jgi:hypothetical protein
VEVKLSGDGGKSKSKQIKGSEALQKGEAERIRAALEFRESSYISSEDESESLKVRFEGMLRKPESEGCIIC